MSITSRKAKDGRIVYDSAFMYNNIRYKKRGFKTKGEAETWEIAVKYEINKNGSYFAPCTKTFIQVWEEYYETEKDKYSHSTLRIKESTLNIIKKHKIHKRKIVELRYKELQAYFNELGKTHGKSTCKNVKSIFNNTFKFALQNDYIENNPMLYVKHKGLETAKKKKFITYEEFETICAAFLEKEHFSYKASYIALNIGYYTGARISEVLALSKYDIDFENNTISFNKRLECKNYDKEAYTTDRMKTNTSNDVVPLADPLKEILLEWFEINPYDDICVKESGKFLRVDELEHFIRVIREQINIDFHFHMLRHTYASNLVNSGVNINIAKKLLRHSTIQTTLDIYTHSTIQDEKTALDMVFSQEKRGNYPKITPNFN